MKNYILRSFSIFCLAGLLASCGENSWNDHLDGFEGGADYNKATSATCTLSSSDYEIIRNELYGMATTSEEKNEANAIKNNNYFIATSLYPDYVAIPYFLSSYSSPYFNFANGSTVEVTYMQASDQPAEISAIMASSTYTLTEADYQTAWKSEISFIEAFAPETPAATNLPVILKSNLPDAVAGNYAIVSYNVASQNPMFGFSDESSTAVLYSDNQLTAGSYFMAGPEKGVVACNLASSVNYGYLPSSEVTVADEYISGIDPFSQQFILEETGVAGEFFIKDVSTGRYYYQSGTYNSFNVSNDMTAADIENYTWVFTPQANNQWKILNKGVEKWIQTPFGNYDTWGSYNYAGDDKNNYPTLYKLDEEPAQEPPIYIPTYETKYAVYYFNGTSWSLAEQTAVLNPADYEAMGESVNKLTDASIYIPLYLKANYPYSQEGDEMYVAYNVGNNSCACDLFVYDGSNWTLNNNGLEELTALFTKTNDKWVFTKYLGKTIYNYFAEDQLQLNRSYLFVYGSVCANPVPSGDNYGYLLTTSVNVSGETIVMSNDNNAFYFADTFIYNDVTYKTPEGKFVIRDSNGRYLYLSGTYNSFNVRANSPYIEDDGSIGAGYLFSAKLNDDGTWTIYNTQGDLTRTVYYSVGYNNFAAYDSQKDGSYLPNLYLLDE